MGNIFGRDQNQLDFRGIHTEQYSDNIPYLNKLEKDSQLLANKVNTNNDTVSNRKMYDMFNAQNSELNFSDTSPLGDTQGNDSATSAVNTEIAELLNKIQKGGSLNTNNQTGGNVEPTQFVNEDLLKNLLTETNQTGGNLMTQFLNEDMLKNLMTETNQSGGFFWNKKEPANETFINEETFKSLMQNSSPVNDNATSANNTEMNEYMKNAITELTSTIGGNNKQVGGDMHTSSEEEMEMEEKDSSSSSENKKKVNSESLEESVEEAMEEMGSEMAHMNGRSNYESSSAHSDAIDSHNSNMSSTVSGTYSGANDKYLSDSINTSDINMISVE
jgi:hypothetical protein